MTAWNELLDKREAWTEDEWLLVVKEGLYAGQWPGKIAARVAYEQTLTIREFDRSSRRLTRWLITLTVVLVALTLVIAGFTILLWRRG